jgi:hypothetical protein
MNLDPRVLASLMNFDTGLTNSESRNALKSLDRESHEFRLGLSASLMNSDSNSAVAALETRAALDEGPVHQPPEHTPSHGNRA